MCPGTAVGGADHGHELTARHRRHKLGSGIGLFAHIAIVNKTAPMAIL